MISAFMAIPSFAFKKRGLRMKTFRFLSVTLLGLTLAAIPAYAATTKDVVHGETDKVVQTKTGACVRTKWDGGADSCGAPKVEPPPAPRIEMPKPAPVVQAPPPAPKPAPARTVVAREARTVYFDFDSDDLTSEARGRLDHLASTLKKAGDVQRADIVGYADPMGKRDYNYALSARRAKAVEGYLHEQGYMNTAIAKTRAVGEDEASTSCSKVKKRSKKIACGAEDRKVEVEIVTSTTVR